MYTKRIWPLIAATILIFVQCAAHAQPATTLIPAAPGSAPAATPTPESETAKAATRRTIVDAYIYKKASTSSEHRTVPAGTAATILGHNTDWAKVKIGKVTGYMRVSAFQTPSTISPTPTPAPAYPTLKIGSKGESVLALQQRLEVLGYLDIIPNGKYATTTSVSIREFQYTAGLKRTGIADAATQVALYASAAPKSTIFTYKLQYGSKGTAVKRLQLRLRSKGYTRAAINGKLGSTTAYAIARFQDQVGLNADGIAGSSTLTALYSPTAPAYGETAPTPAPTQTPAPTAAPQTTPAPTAPSTSNASREKQADIVIEAAMAQLGKPYVYAASGPNSFDCSGLMVFAYAKIGLSLPHSAYQMGYSVGTKRTRTELRRGDLVFWNTVADSDLCDHVGIYMGNGQAIHASSGSGKVVVSSIDSGYYQKNFSWGRDVLGG